MICIRSFRFDNRTYSALTDYMSIISELTVAQLRTAANLKERMAVLQKQLDALLGAVTKPTAAKPAKKKRTMSPAARARIAAAQKARWAKVRAEGKK